MYTVYVLTFLKQESPKALLGMYVPRSKGPGKRGHIVAHDVSLARKRAGHKMNGV